MDRPVTSAMFRPVMVTASTCGFRRFPSQAGHGFTRIILLDGVAIVLAEVSVNSRSISPTTPGQRAS